MGVLKKKAVCSYRRVWYPSGVSNACNSRVNRLSLLPSPPSSSWPIRVKTTPHHEHKDRVLWGHNHYAGAHLATLKSLSFPSRCDGQIGDLPLLCPNRISNKLDRVSEGLWQQLTKSCMTKVQVASLLRRLRKGGNLSASLWRQRGFSAMQLSQRPTAKN